MCIAVLTAAASLPRPAPSARSQLGPMGKVWESGAVQVVQCADSLSDDAHPRNRLPGGLPGGMGLFKRMVSPFPSRCAGTCRARLSPSPGIASLAGQSRRLGHARCVEERTSLPAAAPHFHPLFVPPMPAGELTGRIAECIYLPVYDRSGQGACCCGRMRGACS